MALKIVNFGSGKGGLATIGYTIYGVDGAEIAARSTAGVVEYGTSTGIYGANITMPDYDAVVLWDTGDASPKYATEDYQHQIQDILDNTGRIGNIYNSVKNIGEFMSTLADRMGLLPKNEGLQKINDKIDALSKKENITLGGIEELVNKSIGRIKLPDFKQKDTDLSPVVSLISSLQAEINKIPKAQQKDYSGYFSSLNKHLASISEYFAGVKVAFSKFDDIIAKIGNLNDKLSSLDANDKDFIKEKKKISEEMNKLNQFVYLLSSSQIVKDMQGKNDLLLSFGHLGRAK